MTYRRNGRARDRAQVWMCMLALALPVFLGACGDDDGTTQDSGTDATVSDGGADATTEDGGTDGDVATDGGRDDAGPEDGGAADSGPDAGMVGPWPGCVGMEAFVGDDGWTDELVVPERILCTITEERTPLEESISAKAQVWFTPGTYPFPPVTPGEGDAYYPLCVRRAGDTYPAPQPAMSTYEVTHNGVLREFELTTPFDDGQPFVIDSYIEYLDGQPMPWPGFELGSLAGGFVPPGVASGTTTLGGARMAPCGGTDWPELRAAVQFDEVGELTFYYRGIAGSVQTGPSSDFRVEGTIQGEVVDVDDYFRIFYSPGHHHDGGQYAVLFDAPIEGACGIRLDALGGSDPSAYWVNCDLSMRDPLRITSYVGPWEE